MIEKLDIHSDEIKGAAKSFTKLISDFLKKNKRLY